MIDWLRRKPGEPRLVLAGREVPVAIRRHPTARRMTLRLAPDGSEVRLTLPRWGRTIEGLDFAASRRDWLEAQLLRVPEAAPPAAGGTVLYRGEELALLWQEKAKRRPVLTGEGLTAGGPHDGLPARIRRWLETEAEALLTDDLGGYCTLIARKAPPLRLSRAQRRWGSCATDGTIRINWRLIQAPDLVRRSVVAHEVAHLVHFDHSPAFHALLGELYEGDIRAANRWLKQHGRTLYSRFG
ncbi:MAG: M48 family metallopeptidase [Novosphingobium sp.]|nr:M48 family metallopeptidase [Novosphingobium sp.]